MDNFNMNDTQRMKASHNEFQQGEKKGTYFFCAKREIPALVKKAEAEAEIVLKDFKQFFKTSGELQIKIEPIEHVMCWSIGATLTWDGSPIQSEDDASLLFLALNEMILDRMLKSGMPSFCKS